MYFFKQQGKQYLDLTGNLILSHNDALVKARVPSAAPVKVLKAKFVLMSDVPSKIKATIAVIRFIWGKSTALKPEDTNLKEPVRNDVRS